MFGLSYQKSFGSMGCKCVEMYKRRLVKVAESIENECVYLRLGKHAEDDE